MQRMMEENMKKAKEEAKQQAASEAKTIKDAEQGKIQMLMEAKRALEQQLQEVRVGGCRKWGGGE